MESRQGGSDGLLSEQPPDANWPGVVVYARHTAPDETRSTTLYVISTREDPPILLLSEVLHSSRADGGGFSTLESLGFVRVGESEPLAVQMRQTSTPGSGAEPYMPGPPETIELRWNGSTYERRYSWSPALE